MSKKETPLGDIIMGIILLIGIFLFVYTIGEVRMYAPRLFWVGLGFIAASAIYFTIRKKGISEIF